MEAMLPSKRPGDGWLMNDLDGLDSLDAPDCGLFFFAVRRVPDGRFRCASKVDPFCIASVTVRVIATSLGRANART